MSDDDQYIDILAPTPFHRAALEGDINIAIDAFNNNIPYPDPSDPSSTPFSPFSPIDIALLHPCNYRLITLFSTHGHKPFLSESNSARKRRLKQQQAFFHLLIAYRMTNQNPADIEHQKELNTNIQFNLSFPDPQTSPPPIQPIASPQESTDPGGNSNKTNDNDNNDDDDDNIHTDHECCLTFSDLDDEDLVEEGDIDQVISAELYTSILNAIREKQSKRTPEIIEIESLPLPNRLLLLTATMMTDIKDNNDEYLVQLLAQSITLRCMKLLEDIADGTIDVNNTDLVKHEICDVNNFYTQIKSNAPSLFQHWEEMIDFDASMKPLQHFLAPKP